MSKEAPTMQELAQEGAARLLYVALQTGSQAVNIDSRRIEEHELAATVWCFVGKPEVIAAARQAIHEVAQRYGLDLDLFAAEEPNGA